MKYYTAFIYDQAGPSRELHCTHKYLGGMSRTGGAKAAIAVIDEFLANTRPVLPQIAFQERSLFGPRQNIPVLLGLGYVSPEWHMLRDLLSNLGQADDYLWTPHVTTSDVARVTAPFSAYALMSKGKIIKEWKL